MAASEVVARAQTSIVGESAKAYRLLDVVNGRATRRRCECED